LLDVRLDDGARDRQPLPPVSRVIHSLAVAADVGQGTQHGKLPCWVPASTWRGSWGGPGVEAGPRRFSGSANAASTSWTRPAQAARNIRSHSRHARGAWPRYARGRSRNACGGCGCGSRSPAVRPSSAGHPGPAARPAPGPTVP
jgi:hypothetical protein